ncbi:MAG: TPM domain-containing protein [Bacteroidales bacterium]|nr:TPM domain-containing protein [Bacteroidales bacterium]
MNPLSKPIAGTVLWCLWLLPGLSLSQTIPPRPEPPMLVNDFTSTLSGEQVSYLERKLVAFDDSTGTQIAVVLVNDLGGYDKIMYAYEIGEKWGVGRAGFNNGVVVLVKPKTEGRRGEAAIVTGYGLEPVITDALSKRIIEHEMIPYFKKEDYFTGLDSATSVIMGLAAGEFTGDDYRKKTGDEGTGAWWVPILVLIIIIWLMSRGRSSRQMTGKGSLPFWTALWLLGSMSGRGGNWKDFNSGGGIFGGGGGGGGFGGFGGGSFGGGGAGGSW